MLLRHALRTSLIAFVSLFGLDFGALVGGGALLTEVVFGLHGVGKLTYDSLQNLDLPVIMATVMYAAFFVVARERGRRPRLRLARPAGAAADLTAAARGARPERLVPHRGRRRAAPSTASRSRSAPARCVGIVGESGSGQDRLDDGGDAPDPRSERDRRGRGALPRPRPDAALAARDARGPRRRDRDDLPGSDDRADARSTRSAGRSPSSSARTSAMPRGRRARADRRAADGGRHPEPGAARRRLPAPVLGRDAAARDDRDGALLQPVAPDRRRADDRARRHDPGADPRADEAPPARPRLLDPPDHPRHGRRRRPRRAGRRHVRGQRRRGGAEGRESSAIRSTRTPGGCSARSRASTGRACAGWRRFPARRRRCSRRREGCRFAPRCRAPLRALRDAAGAARARRARPQRTRAISTPRCGRRCGQRRCRLDGARSSA